MSIGCWGGYLGCFSIHRRARFCASAIWGSVGYNTTYSRERGPTKNAEPLGKLGAPGRTRIPNLLIRSQTLYPIELRALILPPWPLKPQFPWTWRRERWGTVMKSPRNGKNGNATVKKALLRHTKSRLWPLHGLSSIGCTVDEGGICLCFLSHIFRVAGGARFSNVAGGARFSNIET